MLTIKYHERLIRKMAVKEADDFFTRAAPGFISPTASPGKLQQVCGSFLVA